MLNHKRIKELGIKPERVQQLIKEIDSQRLTTKAITGIVLLLLLASQVQAVQYTVAEAQKTVVGTKLISSEYGKLGEWFDVGDRLYKISYDDGSKTYKLIRTSTLEQAFITQIPTTLNVPSGGYVDILFTVTGISEKLDGLSMHYHTITVSNSDTGEVLKTDVIDVNSGKTYDDIIPLGKMPDGTYNFKVKETIKMSTGAIANGDTKTVMVKVGAGSPIATAIGTSTPVATTATGTAIPTPSTTTVTSTPTSTPSATTVTSTPVATTTSSVEITYAAGGGETYRGVDIRFDNGVYYVGDIPYDSKTEAKTGIDEMIASKEQKEQSIFDTIESYWLGIVIAVIGGGYVLLSGKKPGKGKKKKGG